MKTKLFVILALVLTFALSSFAAQTTVTGILTDDMCTKKHMMPGKANADCVRDCIKHGAKYVIVLAGKVVQLSGNGSSLGELAGKKVTVVGELKGNILKVSSAKSAE